MLFNSIEFLLFFLIVIPLYFLLPHRLRWGMLLIASSIFYMYFKPVYILILLVTILIDYFAGIAIERTEAQKPRKLLLVLSLISNIGILFFFKYFNFISENLGGLLSLSGREVHLPVLNMLLPIGLSFHTFQAMSYTIEVYRGKQKAEKHLGYYALYVLYFPQLVAGPIERPQNILHQLREDHKFDYARFIDGLQLMLWGLFKKMVIADRLSVFVDTVYNNPHNFSGLPVILATVFFAFQIYCDFSGYTDVARGVSRIMGIELMVNFRRPYLSQSVSEFWRRWHISLSTWFRDYLYIPLGGSRGSSLFKMRNTLIVFGISGLWHGANWTYIFWGLLNGAFIIGETMLRRDKLDAYAAGTHSFGQTIRLYFNQLVCFILICFTWVFFRANSMGDAMHVIGSMFSFHDLSIGVATVSGSTLRLDFILILLLLMLEHFYEYRPRTAVRAISYQYVWLYVLAVCIFTFGIYDKQAFIYFQF
ncbi:MAG: putative rane protein involved in D-alanine export [Flaviaesturariibacter sp.]|nr:putative rane protein involved in D-alanine export [Flaviaesturariibacter sp.]